MSVISISKTPLIALISTSHKTEVESTSVDFGESSEVDVLLSSNLKQYSDLLWTLRRLGVVDIIAHDYEKLCLEQALDHLERPPKLMKYSASLLQGLHEERRNRFIKDPINESLWTENINLMPIPKLPFEFDQIKLCFHDELIGSPDAFLIHYGASHHQVSGYHHPISAISVPISDELSALLISQLPYQDNSGKLGEIETCVMHLSSQGHLLKGPWWPRRHQLVDEL